MNIPQQWSLTNSSDYSFCPISSVDGVPFLTSRLAYGFNVHLLRIECSSGFTCHVGGFPFSRWSYAMSLGESVFGPNGRLSLPKVTSGFNNNAHISPSGPIQERNLEQKGTRLSAQMNGLVHFDSYQLPGENASITVV